MTVQVTFGLDRDLMGCGPTLKLSRRPTSTEWVERENRQQNGSVLSARKGGRLQRNVRRRCWLAYGCSLLFATYQIEQNIEHGVPKPPFNLCRFRAL
jgi:hypothetical protein